LEEILLHLKEIGKHELSLVNNKITSGYAEQRSETPHLITGLNNYFAKSYTNESFENFHK
jgi:hypothetical protein